MVAASPPPVEELLDEEFVDELEGSGGGVVLEPVVAEGVVDAGFADPDCVDPDEDGLELCALGAAGVCVADLSDAGVCV